MLNQHQLLVLDTLKGRPEGITLHDFNYDKNTSPEDIQKACNSLVDSGSIELKEGVYLALHTSKGVRLEVVDSLFDTSTPRTLISLDGDFVFYNEKSKQGFKEDLENVLRDYNQTPQILWYRVIEV